MSSLFQRLTALAFVLCLTAGNGAACAGWLATAEARMACCAEDADCPMHKGDASGAGARRLPTQAQADSCCAVAESRNGGQAQPSPVPVISSVVLGIGVLLPATVPAIVLSDDWRTSAPVPSPPVPRHVFLSVFVV